MATVISGIPGPWSEKLSRNPARPVEFSNLNLALPAFAMFQGIACEFAGCRNDLRLVYEAKANFRGTCADHLAHDHDVTGGPNR